MYGTVARLRVRRENVDALRATLDEMESRPVEGFVASYLLVPDQWIDEMYLVVLFRDKDSYVANADDPAQHEQYLRFRTHLDADPEWTDGEWISVGAS